MDANGSGLPENGPSCMLGLVVYSDKLVRVGVDGEADKTLRWVTEQACLPCATSLSDVTLSRVYRGPLVNYILNSLPSELRATLSSRGKWRAYRSLRHRTDSGLLSTSG